MTSFAQRTDRQSAYGDPLSAGAVFGSGTLGDIHPQQDASPDQAALLSRSPLASLAICFAKYGLAGGTALATHLAVLWLLVSYVGVDDVVATAIGFACALPVNFAIQYTYVFRADCHPGRSAMRYLGVSVATWGLNVVLFWIATDFGAIQYMLAQILVTGFIAVVNFVVNKFYTFSSDAELPGHAMGHEAPSEA